MIQPEFKEFVEGAALLKAVTDLLAGHLTSPKSANTAIMLSGGRTPLPAYAALAESGIKAAPDTFLLFSDDRMVPPDSADSNYGNTAAMIEALGVPDECVLRVNTKLGLHAAAQDYHRQIEVFLKGGGHIVLGLLGLGADGHTASIFSGEDAARGGDAYAMAAPRPDGLDRVSVTPKLLERIDRTVFLVEGAEKVTVIQRFLDAPESLPAGVALARARNVELWKAP